MLNYWVSVCVSVRVIFFYSLAIIFRYSIGDNLKVVQGIISELESQGALPRSNSRVSSLATCCGPRLVEQLAIGLIFLLLFWVHFFDFSCHSFNLDLILFYRSESGNFDLINSLTQYI